jgi:hypothetical protein
VQRLKERLPALPGDGVARLDLEDARCRERPARLGRRRRSLQARPFARGTLGELVLQMLDCASSVELQEPRPRSGGGAVCSE